MESSERRQRIVEAALDLLADTPPEELSTRKIARRVGVSQPALFRHFRSRDQILIAVVEESQAAMGRVAEEVLGRESGAEARLMAMARALLLHVEHHPGLPRLLFADAFPGNRPARAALKRLLSMQQKLFAELVRQGQTEGALDATLDASLAATALIGLLQGHVLQWQILDRKSPLATASDDLVRIWLHGVRARGPAKAKPSAAETPGAPAPVPGGLRSLDVRPILARGEDPLDTILNELEAAGPTGCLRVTAPFRPAPLIALLSGKGCRLDVRQPRAGVWVVEILPKTSSEILDLSDLEPPEPMERVLAAAEKLGAGKALLARLPRFPKFLLPELASRGLEWEVLEIPEGALLRAWRPTRG